jgi:UDP-N-acetylglucosamine 2-epimerase (non-hydrolysing)
LPPLDYPDFVGLLDRCYLVLTDSGGIQEEAPSLGKPVLVMRDTTERPEAVDAGAAELVGTRPQRIVAAAARLLDDPLEHARRRAVENPFGDGRAAERIVELLLNDGWRANPDPSGADAPVCAMGRSPRAPTARKRRPRVRA